MNVILAQIWHILKILYCFHLRSKNSAVITVHLTMYVEYAPHETDNDPSINTREINQKLKTLKINLYKNTLH